jgi:hypothetical protein
MWPQRRESASLEEDRSVPRGRTRTAWSTSRPSSSCQTSCSTLAGGSEQGCSHRGRGRRRRIQAIEGGSATGGNSVIGRQHDGGAWVATDLCEEGKDGAADARDWWWLCRGSSGREAARTYDDFRHTLRWAGGREGGEALAVGGSGSKVARYHVRGCKLYSCCTLGFCR